MNPLLLSIWQIADYLEQEPLPSPIIPKDLQIYIPPTLPPKPQPRPQPTSSNPPSRVIYTDNSHNKNNPNTDNSIYSFDDNHTDSPTLNQQHNPPTLNHQSY